MTLTIASPPSTTRIIKVQGQYGFANIDDDIFLIQLDSSPAPRTYRVHVFRHDFVSVFPYSHTQIISSSDLLELFENDNNETRRCWLEEDTATVFVAQDVMSRFIRLKDMLAPTLGPWRPPTSRPWKPSKRRTHRLTLDGASPPGMAAV